MYVKTDSMESINVFEFLRSEESEAQLGSSQMPGGFSRWTAAQAALATSDEAVIEITSKEDFWHAWDTIGRSFAGDADHVGEPSCVWMLSTVAGFGPGNAHHIPYITFTVSMDT